MVISEGQEDAAQGKVGKQKIRSEPTGTSRGRKSQKRVLQATTELVTVPIQILTGRMNGPLPTDAHTPSKRKPATQIPRPVTINKKQDNKAAQMDLNPEDYYKVRVDKDLCRKIDLGCGMEAQEVEKVL